MDNYYDQCMKEIKECMEQGDMSAALKLVQQELEMPYVPEPYFSQLQDYLNDIVVDTRPRSQFFETVEAIEEALQGNESLQQKAILSLERMNLRSHVEWCEDVLSNAMIADWIKKQILLFMMEQEMNHSFEVFLDGDLIPINIGSLKHPQSGTVYETCLMELQDALESDNPSMLIMCVGELDFIALESFPHELKEMNAQSIIKRVQSYF